MLAELRPQLVVLQDASEGTDFVPNGLIGGTFCASVRDVIGDVGRVDVRQQRWARSELAVV